MIRCLSILVLSCAVAPGASQVIVSADGSGDFRTVQSAVDAAPADGSVIAIRPGIYREHIQIAKPFIELRGLGKLPQDVVLTFDLSNGTAGGTGVSASTVITGDDFTALNLTFENSFSRSRPLTPAGSQAVALRVTGDRAIFCQVRFLGYQDTLYADGKGLRDRSRLLQTGAPILHRLLHRRECRLHIRRFARLV